MSKQKDNNQNLATDGTKIKLEERKACFIEAALELGFEAKIIEICEKSGVPKRTFYNWLDADPQFKDLWDNLWKRELKVGWPDSCKALMRQAKRGDVSAIKLHAQLIGEYEEKVKQEVTGNIETTNKYDFSGVPKDDLTKILETIQAAKKE